MKETVEKIIKKTRKQRLVAWYSALSKPWKIVFWSFIALAAIGLVQTIVSITLFYKSITSDDVSIFVSLEPDIVTLNQGQATDLTLSLSVRTLPFCEAKCEWNAHEVGSGKYLASDTVYLSDSKKISYDIPVSAAVIGERNDLVKVAVVCQSEPTELCRSGGEIRHSADVTRVQTKYSFTVARQKEQASQAMPSWIQDATELLRELDGIRLATIAHQDTWIATFRNSVETDVRLIESRANNIQAALERDDFSGALKILEQEINTPSLEEFNEEKQSETSAITFYNELLSKQEIIYSLEKILLRSSYNELALTVNAAQSARTEFLYRLPSESTQTFSSTLQTINSLEQVNTPIAINSSITAQQTLAAEYKRECLLTGILCANATQINNTLQNASNQNLVRAVNSLENTCKDLTNLDVSFASARESYARAQAPASIAQNNLSEIENHFGVAAFRASSNFSGFENNTLVLINSGIDPQLNITETLAMSLTSLEQTNDFVSTYCSMRAPALSLYTQAPTPINITPSERALPFVAVKAPVCCSEMGCTQCPAQQSTPVIFVHGFSFSQSTSPENNLNAFGLMAQHFDEKGLAMYAGHIFPQEFTQSESGILQDLPGRFSITTTYYYNSYQQEGETTFVVFKTENLETYSIRLRDAVQAAKSASGSDKVIIVAHSMGGLVSRRYLQLFGEQDVAALIMIGTPNNGITGRTERVCEVFGSSRECEDMREGSVFLTKLNSAKAPSIPVYTFVGTGCDGRDWDGVIEGVSVSLPFANNTIVEGGCEGTRLLHSTLLNPQTYPQVANAVEEIIRQY